MSQITITLPSHKKVTITQSDANDYIIKYLRRIISTEPQKNEVGYADYGYELYLEKLLIEYGVEHLEQSREGVSMWQNRRAEISPVFMDACWELCRRGIIRPYTRTTSDQGSNSPGFTTTAFGKQWLNESNFDDYVPTEPDRFAKLLEPYKGIFGANFHERAQEAVRCYGAHAYLACCAMAGSAAETVLLKTAQIIDPKVNTNTKASDLQIVLKKNNSNFIKSKIDAYSDIIKYWRDSSMHHESWDIAANEAYISISTLLLLTRFCVNTWFEKN